MGTKAAIEILNDHLPVCEVCVHLDGGVEVLGQTLREILSGRSLEAFLKIATRTQVESGIMPALASFFIAELWEAGHNPDTCFGATRWAGIRYIYRLYEREGKLFCRVTYSCGPILKVEFEGLLEDLDYEKVYDEDGESLFDPEAFLRCHDRARYWKGRE